MKNATERALTPTNTHQHACPLGIRMHHDPSTSCSAPRGRNHIAKMNKDQHHSYMLPDGVETPTPVPPVDVSRGERGPSQCRNDRPPPRPTGGSCSSSCARCRS